MGSFTFHDPIPNHSHSLDGLFLSACVLVIYCAIHQNVNWSLKISSSFAFFVILRNTETTYGNTSFLRTKGTHCSEKKISFTIRACKYWHACFSIIMPELPFFPISSILMHSSSCTLPTFSMLLKTSVPQQYAMLPWPDIIATCQGKHSIITESLSVSAQKTPFKGSWLKQLSHMYLLLCIILCRTDTQRTVLTSLSLVIFLSSSFCMQYS